MSAMTPALSGALRGLQDAVDVPPPAGGSLSGWRWAVRQRVAPVREALMAQSAAGSSDDGDWLAARGGDAFRERNVLLGRVADLGTTALEAPDAEAVRASVGHLIADIVRHVG